MTVDDQRLSASKDGTAHASSVGWLEALNFSIADVQNGMRSYVALFLLSSAHWSTGAPGRSAPRSRSATSRR